MRLNYFDYFRAIAILFIVAGHSYSVLDIDTIPEKVLTNIITGGTSLFVFISGFFFHHVFYKSFNYKKFIIKKSKSILIPYLILATVAFFIIVLLLNSPPPQLLGDKSLNIYLNSIWTGKILVAYWYIPFICLVFIASPLFLWFIKLSKIKQLIIFFIFLFISMMVHRPLHNMVPFHSLVYFTPIYLLGIIFSVNQQKLLGIIKNKSLILGGGVCVLSFIQVMLYPHHIGSFHKEVFMSFEGFDLLIIQKIALIFFIISILQKFGGKNIPILKYIASVSFPIFFIHPWILFVWNWYSLTDYFMFLPGVFIFIILMSVAFIGSIILANIVKVIFNKNSSYLIGW